MCEDATVDRHRLVSVAYRMLGTLSDAEDAVQEAYLRWQGLRPEQRDRIVNPQAWLTRVTSRICLDALRKAKSRREQYVGPWLPEPVPAELFAGTAAPGYEPMWSARAADPADRVVEDDSVSTALLVVLDSLTPAERIAFVLHDVFAMPFDEIASILDRTPAAARQLASSGRRRIRERRRHPAGRAERRAITAAFAEACTTGDLSALVSLLDPGVALSTDGGGVVRAAVNTITGPSKVARFLLAVLSKQPVTHLKPVTTADGPALLMVADAQTRGVLTLGVERGKIADLWVQWNPAKLTRWTG